MRQLLLALGLLSTRSSSSWTSRPPRRYPDGAPVIEVLRDLRKQLDFAHPHPRPVAGRGTADRVGTMYAGMLVEVANVMTPTTIPTIPIPSASFGRCPP